MRVTESINSGWRFSKLPADGAADGMEAVKTDFSDDFWEQVALPHTWNDKDGASGRTDICEGGEHYYRGLACYRKRISLDKYKYSKKRLYIEFGAANTVAELYVNGRFAGRHEGGYSAFRFDMTDHVLPGEENIFAVLVNNAPTSCIAPITDQGDFTKMGGLYRGVKLIAVDPLHIDLLDCGSSGVYVTPKNITDSSADADILVKIANRSERAENISASVEILNAEGKPQAADTQITVPANSTGAAELSIRLNAPRLWNGREDPYMYSAKITLLSEGEIVDETVQPFGIREYHFDSEKGFFLNGKYLDLRGVNYHQDSFENGWAMTDEQRIRDHDMMTEMGCTAVRMAHYQHSPHEYELCDRLGLCVWTEIGIVNKMSADDSLEIAEGFAENAKQQLTELIRQNYNHPSVIVWGISNELYQMNDEIFELYQELKELADNEDMTRPKTFADNQFWGNFLRLPTDVVGYNRYFGWYYDAGEAEEFGGWLDRYHTEKEHRPICVSEYGGGGAISQHKDSIDWQTEIDPWGSPHYENYQSELHERIWAQFSARQYLWGKFIWCMFDFASDGRQEGDTSGQNDKGLCTRERVRKDAFYFYKSVWNSQPMVHIADKRFSPRPSAVPQVKVYSNAEGCELFVNGVSQGVKRKADLPEGLKTVFRWDNISLLPDIDNHITVKAEFQNGAVIEDSACWIGS